MAELTSRGIAPKEDGSPEFSIDIQVTGADEDAAEKALMHLKDEAISVAQAYDNELPPEECDGYIASVDWDCVFSDD